MVLQSLMRTTSRLLLVGVGVGGLLLSTPSPAQSQVSRDAIRSLNLSRSQMREMRGIMQGYQSELNEILTADQQQRLEELKADREGQSTSDGSHPDLLAELDLTEDQAAQLSTLQADLAADFESLLSADQLEQAQELGFPGL